MTGGKNASTIASVIIIEGWQASQNSILAQNGWVEIHGANLSHVTEDWSEQDFSKGLPIALGGVSATVNNKPTASHVSPAQVNIPARSMIPRGRRGSSW